MSEKKPGPKPKPVGRIVAGSYTADSAPKRVATKISQQLPKPPPVVAKPKGKK